jgi:hypothetical protein
MFHTGKPSPEKEFNDATGSRFFVSYREEGDANVGDSSGDL